ncbi:MAG: hypothetical protein F4Z00_09325 [Acidimicrobiaceae bacterium]|nr:hypothetical protein [Acidimicrobiaceae bacterium]MXY09871.1 hypothetical protein [Acidimicrobiaceae bacterium]MXZ65736.1 hypothetical protein [Acidimicrobiaceae bacterium]MYF32455.1 hypothetical protein [Acidimicrobiaceae bacterium]MYG77214.1 hypothetical protein [Acidimicrobiaceae bacterium]
METLVQVVTVALAVVAIIWHQQRTIDKLRTEVAANGQRLARIEGFLGIGMPDATASQAAGAAPAKQHPEEVEEPNST